MKDLIKKSETAVMEPHQLTAVLPAVNLYEREHEVVIVADMPGVSEKNIDITVEKHLLTVSGKVDWTEPAGYELRYREFGPAEFRRVFSLTSDLDADNIKAVVKNGVLTLTLPKTEKAKPRKIAVTSA
jgi:HSP20 family protein